MEWFVIFGDWRGDCSFFDEWLRCFIIMGGRRGVDVSFCWLMGLFRLFFFGIEILRGLIGVLGVVLDLESLLGFDCVFIGVKGGVVGFEFGFVWGVREWWIEGSLREGVWDGGVLWMVVFEIDVVGLLFFYFDEMDGKCWFSWEDKVLLESLLEWCCFMIDSFWLILLLLK